MRHGILLKMFQGTFDRWVRNHGTVIAAGNYALNPGITGIICKFF